MFTIRPALQGTHGMVASTHWLASAAGMSVLERGGNGDHAPSSFHPRQALPGRLVAEGRLRPDVLDGLRARGHDLLVADDWSLGRMSAVGRDPRTGFLKAAANPGGMQGYAVGR